MALSAAVLASALALAVLWPAPRGWPGRAARAVLGLRATLERRRLPPEPPLFHRLAASQVGYGPAATKRFSAPAFFRAFQVVRLEDGAVAFQGGPPARELPATTLGEVRRVFEGDFTPLSAPGRYRVVTDDGRVSEPFEVGPGVYDGAVRAVQRAFYYQRAFTEVAPRHAEGPWSHGSDAPLAPPGVAQGWHDAGDLSIYSASATSALFWLLSAQADFGPGPDDTNLPESGNGVPDLLDEARWGLGWLLSVQAPSGGFVNTTCQETYGPYGTNLPEGMAPYRAGEVGTLATGRAVGTLAFAAAVFRGYDPTFAARCLAAAERGQAYLEAHPGEASDGPTCPAMRQDGDARAGREVRAYAAAGLLLASGEARHLGPLLANLGPLDHDPSYLRFNAYAVLLFLRSPLGDPALKAGLRDALRRRAGEVLQDGQRHPFGWAGRTFWGAIAAGFQRTAGFSAPVCLADPAGAAAHCEQVLANVHHALGRNLQGLAYVSGLPGVTRGRAHAFHHWLAALDATPAIFPGLVAGGPIEAPEPGDVSAPQLRPRPAWGYFGDPAMPRDAATPQEARYTDNDSWSTNELDVDWQGVAVYQLRLAQWWARGAPPRLTALPGVLGAAGPPRVLGSPGALTP